MNLKNKIRTIPNFPKKGIMFRDITTLIKDSEAFNYTIDQFYELYKDKDIDLVAGIESRGFIFGTPLAYKLKKGFIPLRKEGKLPHHKDKEHFELEYGRATVEVHIDAIPKGAKILIVDDLIATGGTAIASCKLIERLGGKIASCAFVIGLPDLKGMEKLKKDYEVTTLIDFEGE